MRTRRAALLVLMAVFAAVPSAAQVEGAYRLVSINGQPLPTPSPTEDRVTVHGGAFDFGGDGRFAMSMSAEVDGTVTEQAAGTYRVDADSLRLTMDISGGEPVVLGWRLHGDTLALRDEPGHVYRFVRQAQAAAAAGPAPGTWRLTHVDGQPLPAPWPDNGQMVVAELSLELTAGARVTLRARATLHGETIVEDDTSGYRIAGDRFALVEDDGSVSDEFTWSVEDGKLRLVDEDGAVFTFSRAP